MSVKECGHKDSGGVRSCGIDDGMGDHDGSPADSHRIIEMGKSR